MWQRTLELTDVALWGADVGELRGGQAEKMRRPLSGVIMGFSNSWWGLGAVQGMCIPTCILSVRLLLRLAGSSLSGIGRGRWWLKQGSRRNTSGIYPFRLRGWFGGEPFAYFVNILCYREMTEGSKDGRNGWNHMRSLDVFCPIMTSGKIITQRHYHYTHSRRGSSQITIVIPILGPTCQPELALCL